MSDPFKYREPKPEQVPHFQAVAAATSNAYDVVLNHCPDSAEKTLAIRALQQARMWANAAIAYEGVPVKTTIA